MSIFTRKNQSEAERGTASLVRNHLNEAFKENAGDPNALVHRSLELLETLSRNNGFDIPDEYSSRFNDLKSLRLEYNQEKEGLVARTGKDIIIVGDDFLTVVMAEDRRAWTYGFKLRNDSVIIVNQ